MRCTASLSTRICRQRRYSSSFYNNKYGWFIRCMLIGVICAKSIRVLFLHRWFPSWTTFVLYLRVLLLFNEPGYRYAIHSILFYKKKFAMYSFSLSNTVLKMSNIYSPHCYTSKCEKSQNHCTLMYSIELSLYRVCLQKPAQSEALGRLLSLLLEIGFPTEFCYE
jgi:hypothetical protein